MPEKQDEDQFAEHNMKFRCLELAVKTTTANVIQMAKDMYAWVTQNETQTK